MQKHSEDIQAEFHLGFCSHYVRYVFQELGLSALFLGHALVCAILAIFTFLFVPETRGKTLTELCSIYEC